MKLAALLGIMALLAVACGSDDSSKKSSTTDWANGVCSAITSYRQSLTDAADSFRTNASKNGLQDATEQVQKATDGFVESMKSLGKPDTDAGKEAKETLSTLSQQLNSGLDTVKSAEGTGVVQGLATVTGAFATAQTQVKSAFDRLEGLDAQGELSDAFDQASACASLR